MDRESQELKTKQISFSIFILSDKITLQDYANTLFEGKWWGTFRFIILMI